MSQKVFNPRGRQEKDRLIGFSRERFSGGMFRDSNEIPESGMFHLENVTAHTDCLKGRKGSKLFSDRRLPVEFSMNATKVGPLVTLTGGITKQEIGYILCDWDDGVNKSARIVGVDVASLDPLTGLYAVIEIENTIPDFTDKTIGIRGRINASFTSHVTTKTSGVEIHVFLLIGRKLFVSSVYYTGGGTAVMSDWFEVYRTGRDMPVDAFSTFDKSGDVLLLNNPGGLFRINTNQVPGAMYFWKTNNVTPMTEHMITDVNRSNMWEYGFRYIVTFSKLTGSVFGDRTMADLGVVVEQETCPVVVNTMYDKDYSIVYGMIPPTGAGVFIGSSKSEKTTGAELWVTVYGKNAFSLVTTSSSGSAKRIAIFVDYTYCQTFDDVITVTQTALNQKNSDLRFGVTSDGDDNVRFFFFSSDDSELSSILITKCDDAVIPTDADGDPLYSNTVYAEFGFDTPEQVTFTNNRRNVVNGLSITKDGDQISDTFTHYTVYRTLDVSSAEDVSGALSASRVVNDRNRFTWVADIPMVKPLLGYISGGKLFIDSYAMNVYDIGSMVGFLRETTWEEYEILDIGYDAGKPHYVLSNAQSVGSTYNKVPLVIGSDTVFLGSVDINGVVGGYTFSGSDIGKTLFWSDGSSTLIVDVVSGVARVLGRQVKADQACSLNPNGRSFNDTVSDFTLESRFKSFPLTTRFFDRMPDSSIGCVIPGFVLTADRGFGEFNYCSTYLPSLIGYHHRSGQSNDTIVDGIQSITWNKSSVSIKTNQKTFVLRTEQAYNAGDPKFNESFFTFPDPTIVTDQIGVNAVSHVVSTGDGVELVYTNEPAIRIYDGEKYGKDISADRVRDTFIVPFYPTLVIDYDGDIGVMLWGYNRGGGV